MKNTRLLTIFAILILSLVLTTGVLAAASMAGKHHLMNAANPAFSGKSSSETIDFRIESLKKPEITGLDLKSSTDKSDWSAVDGNMDEGFGMTLNPIEEYHYLNAPHVTATKTLAEGLHGFYVDMVPDHNDFFEYWLGRGVNKDTTNEISGTLWDIITGTLPTFYLNVEGVNPEEQTFGLVDGLLQATGTNDGGDVFWRVYGDYLPGPFTFTGTITDTQDVTNTQTMSITFEAKPTPKPEPVFLPIILNNYSAPLFFDTFDFDRGWNQVSENGANSRVQDGQLVITHTVANRNVRTVAPFEASKIPEFFAVEADMEIVPGFHLGTKYGLLFNWIDANHFYRFIVEPKTGNWWIYKWQSGWHILQDGTDSTNIKQSYITNRLKVERKGNEIWVYANNHYLDKVTDTTYTGGKTGLIIVAATDLGSDKAVAAFDNFVINRLYP